MGKVRINTIGDESAEQKQKIKAEKRKISKKETKGTDGTQGTNVSASVEEKEWLKVSVAEDKKEPKQTTVVKKSTGAGSKRSKKYNDVVTKVDKDKTYALSDAVELLPQIHLAKFDETVELHINTDKTGVSGSVTLPHGTGKQVRVAIISPSQDAQAADALIKAIESGSINFDVLIATPDAMPKLAKVARILGPRGLMPNPKNGTVTAKPEQAAKQFAGGQMNFKTESKAPVIHMSVGKLSFEKEQLVDNITVAIEAVQNKNIKDVTLKSTMSPGIKISV